MRLFYLKLISAILCYRQITDQKWSIQRKENHSVDAISEAVYDGTDEEEDE